MKQNAEILLEVLFVRVVKATVYNEARVHCAEVCLSKGLHGFYC